MIHEFMEKQRFPREPRNVLTDTVKRLIVQEEQTAESADESIISLIETHINVYDSIFNVKKQLELANINSQRIERLIAQALRNIANKLDKSKS